MVGYNLSRLDDYTSGFRVYFNGRGLERTVEPEAGTVR
jgi:hypothetical protein